MCMGDLAAREMVKKGEVVLERFGGILRLFAAIRVLEVIIFFLPLSTFEF